MTRMACLICFAVVACSAACAAADDLDDLMHSLSQRRHGEASFVERQYLSVLTRPVESKGKLIYDAPDRLQKRTFEPRSEDLVLNGNELTVVRAGRSRVLELKAYPQVVPFIEGIRATLAGDRAALERAFRLQFSAGSARWTLVLVPRETAVARTVSEVRIEGSKDDLLQVEIRQPDGDRSMMTLEPLLAQ